MNAINVVGLDLSLACPGLARLTYSPGGNQWVAETWSKKSKGHRDDTLPLRWDRILKSAVNIREWCLPCDFAAVESPAYSRVGGSQHDRSGLWWQVVRTFVALGIPIVEVPSTTVKKWATNNGGADKAAVASRMSLMWGLPLANADEGDALALASIGAQLLELPFPDEVPAYRKAALSKLVVPGNPLEEAA